MKYATISRYNEIINLGFVLNSRPATSTLTQISSAKMNINENNLPLISLRALFVHIFNIGFHNTSLHLPLLLLQLVRFSLHPLSPDPPCNDYIDTNAIYLSTNKKHLHSVTQTTGSLIHDLQSQVRGSPQYWAMIDISALSSVLRILSDKTPVSRLQLGKTQSRLKYFQGVGFRSPARSHKVSKYI